MADRARVLAAGMVAGALAFTPASADVSADRADALTNLLLHDCGACHGLTLKGGLGPPLLPSRIGWKSEDVLADVILDGVPGTPMPPWRFEIAPEEAVWLVRLLKQGVGHEN